MLNDLRIPTENFVNWYANPFNHDPSVQNILLAASKWHDLQRSRGKARPARKEPPAVQRPGAGGEHVAVSVTAANEALERLEHTGRVRDAAAALIARRQATRR